jgi:FkbM family methyltransferase
MHHCQSPLFIFIVLVTCIRLNSSIAPPLNSKVHIVKVYVDNEFRQVEVSINTQPTAAAEQFCADINNFANNCQRLFAAELIRVRNNQPIRRDAYCMESYLTTVLEQIASTSPQRARFLQVGAHVGNTANDPIYHRLRNDMRWTGLLFEPVPHLFKILQKNYASSPRFHPINAAVCNETGQREFYQIARWIPTDQRDASGDLVSFHMDASQLGSFNRDLLIPELNPDNNSTIVSIPVTCLTPSELFRLYGNDPIDYLQCDAEGMDWTIVRSFLQWSYQHKQPLPTLIRLEWKHLNDATASNALEVFSFFGYKCKPIIRDLDSLLLNEDDMGCVLEKGSQQ